MRILGVDVGRRRIGLAISDPSGTLARPLETLTVERGGLASAVDRVAVAAGRHAADEDGLATIVVGVPLRLDGSTSDETAHVLKFIAALKQRTMIPVATEDERLSSQAAESRLAAREHDWRKRKTKLDAAAAAVILQDYLDRRSAARDAITTAQLEKSDDEAGVKRPGSE